LLYEQASVLSRALASQSFLTGGAVLDLGLPLVRRFDAVSHYIEPVLRGGVRGVRSGGDPPIGENLALAAGGFDTVGGDYGGRWGGEVEADGGVIGTSSEVRAASAARLTFDARPFALSAEGAFEPEPDSAVGIARARIGKSDGVYVGASVEAATADAPI